MTHLVEHSHEDAGRRVPMVSLRSDPVRQFLLGALVIGLKSKQAQLYGESKAVGITATSVDANKIVLGQGPIPLNLAFVEVEVNSEDGLPLGVGKNRMAVHTA
jgi:hypothetical protein